MTHGEQQRRSYQEMQSLSAALVCLCVVYILMPRLPRGLPRILCVLPCFPILAWVPFSTRPPFLRSIFSFMFLWVCPSKLLLHCWDIAADCPSPGFLYFIITSVMPLRIRQRSSNAPEPTSAHTFQGALFLPFLQFLFFVAAVNGFWYPRSFSHGWANHAVYCLLIYFGLEGVLGLFSTLTSLWLGVELYPFFDKPFLASSLSEFWGRRWNRLASYLIRETVYVPILHFLSAGREEHETKMQLSPLNTLKRSPQTNALQRADVGTTCRKDGTDANRGMQEKVKTKVITSDKEIRYVELAPLPARAVALLASFIASGLFHELIFYCITQTRATWEVTMFFILHGVATVLEVFLRRKFPSCTKLPQPIAIVCTLAFLFFSGAWLFMPPVIRSGVDLQILAEFHHMQNVIVDFFSRH